MRFENWGLGIAGFLLHLVVAHWYKRRVRDEKHDLYGHMEVIVLAPQISPPSGLGCQSLKQNSFVVLQYLPTQR